MISQPDFKTCKFSLRGFLFNASSGNNLWLTKNILLCPCKKELTNFKVNCFLDLNSSRNVKRNDFVSLSSVGGRKLSNKNSNDDDGDELGVRQESGTSSINFATFQDDPFVYKLRTQLGVMHPIPSPPLNPNVFGLFVVFFFVGVVFDKVWTSRKMKNGNGNGNGNGKDGVDVRGGKGMGKGMWPQVPSLSAFLEKDLQRKESVEWVNMVLEKLWKVYRGGIENWLIGLLQPVIDDLKKPDYVERVVVKQFSLGDEPLSVRNVERRTSRRANDLQYQIGLRYTGGARMLLMLSLKFGIIPIVVPVGVRNFDIDGELWVKLRLVPTEPFVGTASWAFVSLPKIKFDLSPFRLFNLMAIPVLSMFLTKLLTEDLPRLFVRPKKIVLDFQKAKASGPLPNDLKSGEIQEGNKDFSGELSVTLVDARKLSYILYGKTDPYVILKLGDQVISSKKNSQTTVFGPPGEPIWNQDFSMLVSDPRNQKLGIEVKDTIGLGDISLGIGEVDLSSLQDTVPTDRIVSLQGFGLFGKRFAGEILLRLTYKAYVEDEEDEKSVPKTSYISDDDLTDSDEFDDSTAKGTGKGSSIPMESESFMDVLSALIVSEEFQGIVASDAVNEKPYSNATSTVSSVGNTEAKTGPIPESSDDESQLNAGSALYLYAIVTSIAVLTALNISGTSIFNP